MTLEHSINPRFECSVHGVNGERGCDECWARLGDLLIATEEELGEELVLDCSDDDAARLRT